MQRRKSPVNLRTVEFDIGKALFTVIFYFIHFFASTGNLMAWEAPIGIPQPTWPGDLDVARPALPGSWTSNITGFWYIKNGGTNNGNGYPGNPRDSIDARSLSPGDVIVIENGAEYPDSESFTVNGTAANPIWVMSSLDGTRAHCSGDWDFQADYYIVDQLNFNSAGRESGLGFSGRYLMVRNSAVSYTHDTSNGSGFGVGGGEDIVMYGNQIGPLGSWDEVGGPDIDQHGIKIHTTASKIWIVENSCFQVQGDCVQVGDGPATNSAADISHIYIGRNTAYQSCQSGFWTKMASHVVMSENTVHVVNENCTGAAGQAMGGQYDPEDVWFIFNTIHTVQSGIKISGTADGGGGPWYVLGNLIHTIQSDTCNAYDYGAISYRNDGGLYVVHNTLYDVDTYIATVSTGTITIRNNIFASHKNTTCPQINMQEYGALDYNLYGSNTTSYGFNSGSGRIDYPSVSSFRSNENLESHSPTPANPSFVNPGSGSWELQSDSPAINKSNPTLESVYTTFYTTYGLSIKVDRNGVGRPIHAADWDIGAYEFDGQRVRGGGRTILPLPWITILQAAKENQERDRAEVE